MNNRSENIDESSVILISDLYRLRVAESIEFQKMSKDREITEGVEFIREHYRTKSWNCGSSATYLAHCIVQFGDIRLDSIDFEKLRPSVLPFSEEDLRSDFSSGATLPGTPSVAIMVAATK